EDQNMNRRIFKPFLARKRGPIAVLAALAATASLGLAGWVGRGCFGRTRRVGRQRSAANTDSQNRCGSRSPRPTVTHAARSSRPASLIQDRNRTVLPLPAG
ncbi:MAG TPA: hypothetical protein VE864_11445, partial [Streptosporangiaceae bacterium]|nr:hypothetical protein [Streptosporangiaceae bacterium]